MLKVLPLLWFVSGVVVCAEPPPYFRIQVVDQETGRGIPLVELKTVNNIRLYTDSAGVAAFYEPGLMNQDVFFHVTSHGYEFAEDGFGFAGKRLQVKTGGAALLKMQRVNIAQRLYRVTGGGIYRDSVLLGDEPPIREPLLNGMVFGSDSVVNSVYRGQVHWFWGDTNKPSYPLGNFHVPGATSALPADGGLDPEFGVNLSYFVGDDGFAKATARMPGNGPTWIDGLVTVNDQFGEERLFAKYVKIEPPLTVYERGLVEFDHDSQQFGSRLPIPLDAPLQPTGHPLKHEVDGVEYVYFGHPYPHVRVRATAEDLTDLSKYEAYTCLKPGAPADRPLLDRNAEGQLQFAWRAGTPPLTQQLRKQLLRDQLLQEEEGLLHLQDVDTGESVAAHGGSVYWNEYRQRWVAIILESFGTSVLGEIWFAESDSPLGPWVYARKIVTHDKYSFYNPKQHPMFDKDGGRTIFFEGTYTNMFSGNPDQTPRYNYNQIMYKLDLTDPRLNLPVPVYVRSSDRHDDSPRFVTADRLPVPERNGPVGWFALDRPTSKTVPIVAKRDTNGSWRLRTANDPDTPSDDSGTPAFFALPIDTPDPPETTTALHEFFDAAADQYRYSTQPQLQDTSYRATGNSVCLVWRSPVDFVDATVSAD